MSDKLTVGVIGCGSMANFHVRGYLDCGRYEVVALAVGGTTDYVWQARGGLSSNGNIAVRWVSRRNGHADGCPGLPRVLAVHESLARNTCCGGHVPVQVDRVPSCGGLEEENGAGKGDKDCPKNEKAFHEFFAYMIMRLIRIIGPNATLGKPS